MTPEERQKRFYEQLDTVYDGLGETTQEDFIEVVRRLTFSPITQYTATADRWLRTRARRAE